MREVPVNTQGTVERDGVARLSPMLREQRTLGDVLAWGRTLAPPRTVTEIVTQDEYTHDVVLAVEERIYVVYDTT